MANSNEKKLIEKMSVKISQLTRVVYILNNSPMDIKNMKTMISILNDMDKKNYKIGENVEFSFGSKNASTLAIPIDVNGKREFFNEVTNQTSYKQAFTVPGVYGFFLYANNDYGEVSSEYKEFYVYNEKPKDLKKIVMPFNGNN